MTFSLVKSENELPQGWVWTTIGDVAPERVWQNGPTGSEFVYIDISSIDNKIKRIVEPKKLETIDAPSRARQNLSAGDVLVSMTRPNLNAVALVPPSLEGAIGSTGFDVLRTKYIEPAFLFYLVQTDAFVEAMNGLVQGALYPAIRPRDIRSYRFRLPPRPEQARIVSELDQKISLIEAGTVSLKRAQANIRRYRASVLQDACRGKLVPTEAELARTEARDYESADVLLQRILAKRRELWESEQVAKMQAQGKFPKDDKWKSRYEEPSKPNVYDLAELPEGWTWTRVAQVGRVQLGRQRSPEHHYGPYMRPYLRVANVFDDRLDLNDVKSMNFTPEEFEVYRLHEGDILLNEGQSIELVGRSAMYRGEVDEACFQNTLIRFRVTSPILPHFGFIVCRAYFFNGRFQKAAQWTTTIAHLGAERFASIEFPLPPIAEQERIVAEAERLLSVADHMDATLTANLKRADRLKQSILSDAFAGKLVPQDPADQSASALLKRLTEETSVVPRGPVVTTNESAVAPITESEIFMAQGRTRPIHEVLEENNEPILIEDLFRKAGFTPDRVDDFYRELLSLKNRIFEEKDGQSVRIRIGKNASG